MSWKTFHNRGETLRAVVDVANERRDGILPLGVPGVADHFADELDLIGALLLKWHARLSGNIERAFLLEPMDLESAVATAWRTTAEQMPGVRMVIDRCVEDPEGPKMHQAMHRAREREWARLATAAGLASTQDAAAVEAGRRVEERARTGLAISLALAQPEPAVKHAEETAAKPAEGTAVEPRAETTGTAAAAAPETREATTESFVDRIKAVLAA